MVAPHGSRRLNGFHHYQFFLKNNAFLNYNFSPYFQFNLVFECKTESYLKLPM